MNTRHPLTPIALAALFALAACGGGSGDDTASAPTPPADSPPGATALSVSGTADGGAAIAAAPVAIKCATGTGSASTGADGRFSTTITGGIAPCVIEVTSSGSSLHSVFAAGSTTANVTPLTELLTAQLAGSSASALFTTFDGAAQAKVTAAGIAMAETDLTAALKSKVDLAGLHPLTGDAAAGTVLDQRLDALAASLAAARLTTAQLAAALVANPGSPAPVQTILQTASAACAGLRSGRYRTIDPLGTDLAFNTQVVEVDAVALTVKESDGLLNTLVDTGNCSFGLDGNTLLVAQSGFGVFRPPAALSSGKGFSIAMPEQALALSELAGTWNYVSYYRDAPIQPFMPSAGYFTLDPTGKVSNNFECIGRAICTPAGSAANVTVNPAGGFQVVASDGTLRIFAYKTGSGAITAAMLESGQRGIILATLQAARTLPAVGDVNTSRSFSINSTGVASALSGDDTRTVTSVDAAAQSYSRTRQSDGSIDGFSINSPRTGMFYRPASVSPVNGGGTINISEILLLPLPGGASVFTSATAPNNFFGLSVNHP